MSASARDRWRALPREVQRSVIANLECDADSCDGVGVFGMSDEDYPGEAKIRRRAFKVAASLLRQAARKERGR